MNTVLFVTSATICIHVFFKVLAIICGKSIEIPVPIGHFVGINFGNVYLLTPAIAYQVFFWFNWVGVI